MQCSATTAVSTASCEQLGHSHVPFGPHVDAAAVHATIQELPLVLADVPETTIRQQKRQNAAATAHLDP